MPDFLASPGSFYNFEGVVYNETVENLILNFGEKTFEDYQIHSENRKKYIEKFLGFGDLRSSERIYNDLNNRLAGFKDIQAS